jgi:hypothetical protein
MRWLLVSKFEFIVADNDGVIYLDVHLTVSCMDAMGSPQIVDRGAGM